MTRATFRKGAKLERMEGKAANPSGALKQVGAIIAAESRKSFREQRHGRDAWEQRSVPNVYGIVADFAKGSTPPARRFESRPALRDTGALSRSIAFRVTGGRSVVIGSNLPYAGTHQYGGTTESETITATVQKALWKWLKPKDKGMKAQLGFLLNKKFRGERLSGEVPARPFVGITDTARADIREVVGSEILEVQ